VTTSAPLANITVVAPVGPDDQVAPLLLTQLDALPPDAEVFLVYADVSDDSVYEVHLSHGGPTRRLITAPPGRATQQNAGARVATRDWLWFLHADSHLAPETLSALAAFVQRGEEALGYFDLYFLDDGPALTRLNAFGARLRSRWFDLPFGDQGLVMLRRVFEELGGFDTTLQRGEDHELLWRARRAGIPVRRIGARLYTSARKYAEEGWWSATAWHIRETWRQARRFTRPPDSD